MATLTEEEFAKNCVVPGYGKLLYKEMGKLRIAYDKTKKYKTDQGKTTGAREPKSGTPEKASHSLVSAKTPERIKEPETQSEDTGGSTAGKGAREHSIAMRSTPPRQVPKAVTRSASASFVSRGQQVKGKESTSASSKPSFFSEQKRAQQAFEQVYQSIKMNCLRTLLKKDSQTTEELKEVLCSGLSEDAKGQGTELFVSCCLAEESFVQMQTAANKSFLQFLGKAQLMLDFVKQARADAGNQAGDGPGVAAALEGALGNFTLDEISYSSFLLELCKKYPRLTQAIPLQTFWKVLVDSLPGSDPRRVGHQFADFFGKRAGADKVETTFWTSFI